MLFRKLMGRESSEATGTNQNNRSQRHERSISGPLDYTKLSYSSGDAPSKSIIAPTNDFGLPDIPSSSLGYRSTSLRQGQQSIRPHNGYGNSSSHPQHPTKAGNHDINYYTAPSNHNVPPPRRPQDATTASVKFDKSVTPASVTHARSRSTASPSEKPDSTVRSRRHGMHLHSVGNMVTTFYSKSMSNRTHLSIDSTPPSHHGRSSSAPITGCLYLGPHSSDKPLNPPRSHTNYSSSYPDDGNADGNQLSKMHLNPAGALPLGNRNMAEPSRTNDTISKPPSAFPHDRKLDPAFSYSQASKENTNPCRRLEYAGFPDGRNSRPAVSSSSNPISVLNVSSDDSRRKRNSGDMHPPFMNEQRTKVHRGSQELDNIRGRPMKQENNGQLDAFGPGANAYIPTIMDAPPHPSSTAAAKDRLLKEINKLPPEKQDSDSRVHPYHPQSNVLPPLDRNINSQQQESDIETTRPLALRPKRYSVLDINSSPPLPSQERESVDNILMTQHMQTKAPRIQPLQPQACISSNGTSSSISAIPNALPPSTSNGSSGTHNGVECLCKECNRRITQLEHEVRGLRYLILELTKSPDPIQISHRTSSAHPQAEAKHETLMSAKGLSLDQAKHLAEMMTGLASSSDSASSYSNSLETPERPFSYSEKEGGYVDQNANGVDKLDATRKWGNDVEKTRGAVDYDPREKGMLHYGSGILRGR